MKGSAEQTQLCGKIVKLGDYVEVEYKSGGSVKGEIIELWGLEEDDHLQGRVSVGWCFHDYDTITKHESAAEEVPEIIPGTMDALNNLVV